ncbi:MAG: hypothetical protein KF863_21290 [Rubrivivax sp.]|nr:hypothetical protein [Rubrivivax sp.]
MRSPATSALLRLPREPYPGLRPFLDFEAALLFGRERQVREVIERLAQTQFVAVLGGSGSGKSSLIRAGVTPELRAFGIPGAGDLWLPLTVTPGTNVSAADSAARRHTPITRLARRFAELLTSRGSDEADAQRLLDIAEAFRQPAGFARLVDAYSDELALSPGSDPREARLLFVIDQFEEIFHPTNRGVIDATLLVERVLDHFFDPHPRCFIVLTMRSEHLNDCAAFLELPDAINKSSFLVRRLDPDELREAIVGPAQRFLRLVARSAGDQQTLPRQVVFDDAVLQRLLRDVSAITHDPDHLPLLQHLLARLWQAALEREEMDVAVPSHISEIDLVRAVNADTSGDEEPLPPDLNTLRACVQNWPETIYRWHDEAQRAQLDAVLRQLGFKDPNTGLYSQQRIDVDAFAPTLAPGWTRDELKALVAEGFLGSVDYLFWDDEDPSRVTLKVSHESFIRGWDRLRGLIDTESAHFEEFLGVLRKAADWSRHGRDEDYLLESGEMRRLDDGGFVARAAAPAQREIWRRFLSLDRDGQRLAPFEPELDEFVGLSDRRLRERVARQERAKASARWAKLLTVVGALVPIALFSVFVQGPTLRRADTLFDAGNRVNRAAVSFRHEAVGDGATALDSLLGAAERVDTARRGDDSLRTGVSRWLVEHLAGVPLVGGLFEDQRDFLARVFAQTEPPVNNRLRQLLTGAVWRANPGDSGEAIDPPKVYPDGSCAAVPGLEGVAEAARGRLFVAEGRRAPGDNRPWRALFVPDRPSFDRRLEVFGASVDPDSGACLLGAEVLSRPEALDSRVVIDAGLRYFYYTVEGEHTPVKAVIVQQIDWERGSDGQVRALQRETVTTMTDAGALDAVHRALGELRADVVPTWRVPGGRRLEVGHRSWRLVASQAQRVDLDKADVAGMQALQPAAADSTCLAIRSVFTEDPGYRKEILEHGQHCFMVRRGWPAAMGAGVAGREEVLVAIYERPASSHAGYLQRNPPAPVASLLPFARVPVATDADARWFVGVGGPYDGWLLMRSPFGSRQGYIGLPWSTCALWRMGRELQQHNPLPDGRTSAEPVGECRS